MKGVKFAGQKDPDGSHDEEGHQEGRDILSGFIMGGGSFSLGGIGSLKAAYFFLFRIEHLHSFLFGFSKPFDKYHKVAALCQELIFSDREALAVSG